MKTPLHCYYAATQPRSHAATKLFLIIVLMFWFSEITIAQTPIPYANAHSDILQFTGLSFGNGGSSLMYGSLWRTGLFFGAYPNNSGGADAQSYSTTNMGAARFMFQEWNDRIVIGFSSLPYGGTSSRFTQQITWQDQIFIRRNGHMGIGIDACTGYRLNVAGKIAAEEVNVLNPGWCDYVFNDDYELMSLHDLKRYIATYSKLPEVPSEADVEAHGVNLAEMNAILLKKIEELTLYLIQQQAQLDELNNKMETLAP